MRRTRTLSFIAAGSLAGLVTAGLVVGVGGVPALAAEAAPTATALAATAPVHGVWLPARELPGTSVASGVASVDAVACAPGAECVGLKRAVTRKRQLASCTLAA